MAWECPFRRPGCTELVRKHHLREHERIHGQDKISSLEKRLTSTEERVQIMKSEKEELERKAHISNQRKVRTEKLTSMAKSLKLHESFHSMLQLFLLDTTHPGHPIRKPNSRWVFFRFREVWG